MKRLLPIFGLLDIISLLRNYKHIIPHAESWKDFPLMTAGNVFLYVLLALSAYFLLRQKKWGLWLTYIQFCFRVAFSVFSFGFLFSIKNFFVASPASYTTTIFWVLVGLEIVRLICTIQVHQKYFYQKKVH